MVPVTRPAAGGVPGAGTLEVVSGLAVSIAGLSLCTGACSLVADAKDWSDELACISRTSAASGGCPSLGEATGGCGCSGRASMSASKESGMLRVTFSAENSLAFKASRSAGFFFETR